MQEAMNKLVGVLGLITFVICVIMSIDLVVERANVQHELVEHDAAAPQIECIDRDGGLFDSCATLDTSTINDLRVLDVLVVDPALAPAPLVEALHESGSYRQNQHGDLVVPAGTRIDTPGAVYVATGEGWLGCEDWVTYAAECAGYMLVPVTAS